MNRPRLIKGLRLALSVWWGIVCVLLVALWVRSYWRNDAICYVSSGKLVGIGYTRGIIAAGYVKQSLPGADDGGNVGSAPSTNAPGNGYMGFDFTRLYHPLGREIDAPMWCPVLCTAVLAAAPWLHSRWTFSLRTLLLATTLIAVVLGLVVWSIR